MGLAAIPRAVWALGLVSLFMDVSSEVIHSLLPLFLVTVLGVSATSLGVLEGVAEALVMVAKMLSGTLSDWLGRRKALAVAGYGLAAFTRPLFALAHSFGVVVAARLIDRLGKGIRGAPRDALIADITPRHLRGASYGLRQSLDTIGALLGPLIASAAMLASGNHFRLVFWIAVAPACISVTVLILFVREPARAAQQKRERPQLHWRDLRHFSTSFWAVVAAGAVFTLARFSEAFLLLRAQNVGVSLGYLPLIMVVMNIAYVLSAYPAGRLSDQVGRRVVLTLAATVLIVADLMLALTTGAVSLVAGVALWGLHMGLSQGLFAALVADAAPVARRGTAFGLFNLVSGVALLIASVAAGELWDRIGPAATFYAGATFAALTLLGLLIHARRFSGRPST